MYIEHARTDEDAMKLQFGAVLMVGLLTGCYQSDKELFHIVHGEEVQLQKGIYTCTMPDKKRVHYDVGVQQVGTSHRYTLAEVKVGRKNSQPSTITFHAASENTYFVATHGPSKPGSDAKQGVALIRWKGDSIEWIILKNDAKNREIAKKYGVTMGAEWKISGPFAKQHEFLRAVSVEEGFTVFLTCQRDLR